MKEELESPFPRLRRQSAHPTLVVADDNSEVLEETIALLCPEFDILATATNGNDLVQAVRRLRPEVVISDLRMPVVDGLEAAGRIFRENLCRSIILLSMYRTPDIVDRAMGLGVRGYVLKTDAGEELVRAIWAVRYGRVYLSRGVRDHIPGLQGP